MLSALHYSNEQQEQARFERVKQFFEGRATEVTASEGDLLRHLTQ